MVVGRGCSSEWQWRLRPKHNQNRIMCFKCVQVVVCMSSLLAIFPFPIFPPRTKAFKLSFSYLGECVPTVASSLWVPSHMHIVIRKEKSWLERKAISVSLNFYAHSFTIFSWYMRLVPSSSSSSWFEGIFFPHLLGYLVTDPIFLLLQMRAEYPRSD